MYTRRVESLFSHLTLKSHIVRTVTRGESKAVWQAIRSMHHRCITTILFSARKRKKIMNSLYEPYHTNSQRQTMELTAP